MGYCTWDISYNIGIEVIDKQHRRIIDYINELDDAHQNQNTEKITEVLNHVIDYTRSHFSFEENLMENAGYPLTQQHKKIHDEFIIRVTNYQHQHEQGYQVTMQLMYELKTWLLNHIKEEDREYVKLVSKSINPSWLDKTLTQFFKR